MMDRRRALMIGGTGTPTSDLLYNLENQSVETGDQIRTGVSPFKANHACTILLDFTNTVNPTTSGTPASTWRPLVCYDTDRSIYNLMVGKSTNSADYQKLWFNETSSNSATIDRSSPAAARHRYLFVHDANAATGILYYRRGTGTLQTVTRTKASFTPNNATLNIGGASSNSSLPNGTISKAQVWDRIFTQSEIDEFFA